MAPVYPLNPEIDWPRHKTSYREAIPIPHVVIDGFLDPLVAATLEAEFPAGNSPFWHEYNNPLEKKLTCNRREFFPATIGSVLDAMNSAEVRTRFSEVTGIPDLLDDPGLHGGGMHCIRRGGKLDIHLDYSIHPQLFLERRLNLILYLNRDWKPDYGGSLEFWDAAMERCEARILPLFNRAVLFDTGDRSFHGHPEPLNCPEHLARRSLAVYYLTRPRPKAANRYRAQYVPRPTDPKDPEIEKLRRERAGLTTGPNVWRTPG